MEKKKSRLWSQEEINKIVAIIKVAMGSGKTKQEALDEAAEHFGVTRNAIHIRYHRYLKGKNTTRLNRNTIKVATKGTKRGPYKKQTKKDDTGRSMTLKIRDIQINLESREIKIVY